VKPHRLVCAAAGLLIVLGAGAAVAHAAGSPIGFWKSAHNNVYLWKALPGGGYSEYSLTLHKTPKDHCPVQPNTNTYRYHPLGNNIYLEDEFQWDSTCATTSWDLGHEKVKIVVTATRLSFFCGAKFTEACGSYTRTAAKDTVAPVVQALVSTGTVGGATHLHYTVSDNSGKTWEEVAVYRGSLVGRWKTKLGPALKGHVYGYTLTGTPASMKGKLTFCVTSHDAAGNKSKESCAALTIR